MLFSVNLFKENNAYANWSWRVNNCPKNGELGMKNKFLTLILVGILVFSTFSLVAAAKQKCPTCGGTGKVECPTCGGMGVSEDAGTCTKCDGTGTISPKIVMMTMSPSQSGSKTEITASFNNTESVDVNGTVTASLYGHSVTSEEMTFPSHEEVTVTLTIDYNGNYEMVQLIQHVQVTAKATEDITCPYCDGTGVANGGDCPDCDGTGEVECPDCGGTGYVASGAVVNPSGKSSKPGANQGGLDMTLIGSIAGAVVVVAAVGGGSVVFLKKRRPSEGRLRKMSSGEFQAWVIKMLEGKPASSAENTMGIDGYSRSNEPISIKQSDSVGMVAVDGFAVALARNHARSGIIVAFGFADDAIRGKVRARTNYHVDIQLMTVQDLLYLRH